MIKLYINHKTSYLSVLVTCLLILTINGCTDSDQKLSACDIATDTVSIIDEKAVDETTYYLVYRISGWSDKTEILELYDSKPIFDYCGQSDIKTTFSDSLEMTELVSHVYLDIKTKRLNIDYIIGKPLKSHNSQLKLEIQPAARANIGE